MDFRIPDAYLEKYKQAQPPWGFGVLSELVFLRTYSRKMDSGGKERWWQVCRRVVEGMMDIQMKHSKMFNLMWNDEKAMRTALDAYNRLFNLKWSPAGRGLWAMGTELVNGKWDSSALYNCFFVSTKDIWNSSKFAEPFCFLMSASMHGGGVGFDTRGAGHAVITKGKGAFGYKVPDSREGWVKSVELLLRHYAGGPKPVFDYSAIRPKGSPIKTFGGVAPGPGPLRTLHDRVCSILDPIAGESPWHIQSRQIVDLMNVIGVAVVSGNVRRSAEIAFAGYEDSEFWSLKDYTDAKNQYRREWGWMSNNSLQVWGDTEVDYDLLAERMAVEGEPGLMFMDNARDFGRMNNGPDYRDIRVLGANPCGEISLENFEACNLVETYISRHSSLEDYLQTLKYAYMYSKTVTLLPTVWPETNAVQLVNRRIGTSITGTAQFVDTHGYKKLQKWLDTGYTAIRGWDDTYSRWLGVRESIKVTTSKPSGTVSLLAGVSPGVHWPTSTTYIRRVNVADDAIIRALEAAGYSIEDSIDTPGSFVAEIPTRIEGVRAEDNVSVFEKVGLVAHIQRFWADNMVSNTTVFDADTEVADLANALKLFERNLKSVSALPRDNTAYKQMPEERIPEEQYWRMMYLDGEPQHRPVDFSSIYNGDTEVQDAERELGCDNESCTI